MLHNEQIKLTDLPPDIQLKIYGYLSPEQGAGVARVNRISRSIQGHFFWKQKYQKHFPHHYDELLNSTNDINWKAEYRKKYKSEYKKLSRPVRRLFSLVKEEDIASLKAGRFKISDLKKYDSNGESLLRWAQKKGNQAILDYFYQRLIEYYLDSTGLTVDTGKSSLTGRTILHCAVLCYQSADTLSSLISAGAAIDAVTNHHQTPLLMATQEGRAEIVKCLIDHGANINTRSEMGATPLLFAIENNYKEVFDVLLANNANTSIPLRSDSQYHQAFNVYAGDKPLHAAVKLNRIDLVRCLLDKGAAIDTPGDVTPLVLAARAGFTEIAELLISRGANVNARSISGATPLMYAIENNNQHLVDVLLDRNADTSIPLRTAREGSGINARYTPLHAAVRLGRIELVKTLLDNGAAVDAHAHHETALMIAAQEGNAEIAQLLISRGADINARSGRGATPLLFAIEHNHKNVFDILLDHNADSSIPLRIRSQYHDKFKVLAGDTPLHAAARLNYAGMVRSLINKNASIAALNENRQTPVDVAAFDTSFSYELRLLRYSARLNQLPDNHCKKSHSFFGHQFRRKKPTRTVKQERDAANALKSFIFDGAGKSCLREHEDALQHGELNAIRRGLRVK